METNMSNRYKNATLTDHSKKIYTTYTLTVPEEGPQTRSKTLDPQSENKKIYYLHIVVPWKSTNPSVGDQWFAVFHLHFFTLKRYPGFNFF